MTTSTGLAVPQVGGATTASLARQPIVGRSGALHGYELLFRGAWPANGVFDGDRATADVLVTAACDLGWEKLGGGLPLFLNVDSGLLMGDLITLAPTEHTVIEVVEQVEVTDELCARLVSLREAGYRIALDDFAPGSSAERLLPYAHVVKVDVLRTPAEQWPELVARLHEQDLVVLAEKVEDRATHDLAVAAGFDLFQGYWYARPADQPSLALSPRHSVCLRLLTALTEQDLDLGEVEELVSSDPVLAVRTLRMANSAASGAGRTISSVRQAIMLVGPSTLSGWVALMLVADEEAGDAMTSIEILVRARACQLVSTTRYADSGAEAFLAGLIYSMADISGTDPRQLLDNVGASAQIRDAVTVQAGDLGQVLREVDRHVSGFDLDAALDVQMAHLAAVVWGHELLTMA